MADKKWNHKVTFKNEGWWIYDAYSNLWVHDNMLCFHSDIAPLIRTSIPTANIKHVESWYE